MASPVRKLLALAIRHPATFGMLIEAQGALIQARRARRRRPLGQLVRETAEQPPSPSRAAVGRVFDAIERASRFGLFRSTCLEIALAQQRMLLRRNLGPGVIRVGVRVRNGSLTAHAWLELGDLVTGDTPSKIARFEPLSDFTGIQP